MVRRRQNLLACWMHDRALIPSLIQEQSIDEETRRDPSAIVVRSILISRAELA